MADIKSMLSQIIQSPAKSKAAQSAQPVAAGSKKPVDGLAGFSDMLKNGAIKSNLNQPALPYTARKSWIA